MAAVGALVMVASLSSHVGAASLSGADLESFVSVASASCVRAARTPHTDDLGFGPAIQDYCTCYSRHLGGTISADELANYNEGVGAKHGAGLTPFATRISAATRACGATLEGSRPPLKGITRIQFVQSSLESCMGAYNDQPGGPGMSNAALLSYCTCYSNAMAENMSPLEVLNLDGLLTSDAAAAGRLIEQKAVLARGACGAAEQKSK